MKGKTFKQGDYISLDGTTGRVIDGKLKTLEAQPNDPDLVKFMSWVDPVRRLRVRANADIPRDAKNARLFGAEGIGLCRTEHMFFAEDRIEHMRTMILATDEKARRVALKKLLPMQRADFIGLFKAMESLPVTIRLLDPPLHEFLPKREDLLVEIQHLEDTKPRSPKLKELRPLLARVEELHEQNPMLGLRGCRLGITFPEITEMQARAIIEAAVAVKSKGADPHPEIMIPLIGSIEEMRNQAAIVRRVADEVFAEKKTKVDYMVGTMIELPRAALTADQIAEEAEFFSFGTNDLDADHLRHFARRHQQLPAGLSQARHLQAGPLRHPRSGWRRSTGEDGRGQGTQYAPQAQGWHLRRTWRRSRVRQVLPQNRPQLRLLLALPPAHGAVWRQRRPRLKISSACRAAASNHDPLPDNKGVRSSGRPCCFVAPASRRPSHSPPWMCHPERRSPRRPKSKDLHLFCGACSGAPGPSPLGTGDLHKPHPP